MSESHVAFFFISIQLNGYQDCVSSLDSYSIPVIITNYHLPVVLSLGNKYRLLTYSHCTDSAVAAMLKIFFVMNNFV